MAFDISDLTTYTLYAIIIYIRDLESMEAEVVQVTVKARKVGDSVVMTMPTQILRSTGFNEGDSLLLETNGVGFLSVRKENDQMSKLQDLRLQLEVARAEYELKDIEGQYLGRMGNFDEDELYRLGLERSQANLSVKKLELELFRMSGEVGDAVVNGAH